MKRIDLIKEIESFGCELVRQKGSTIGTETRLPVLLSQFRGTVRLRSIWPDGSSRF